jgi:hypothetical protein
VLVTAILQVGHIGIAFQLILVVRRFKKDRIAYLRMSLLFTDVTLQSFPHCEDVYMTHSLARSQNGISRPDCHKMGDASQFLFPQPPDLNGVVILFEYSRALDIVLMMALDTVT